MALGVVDESVYYIQQDYAGDPRQFYFGDKRYHSVQMQSTFNYRQYIRLAQVAEQVMDERWHLAQRQLRGGQTFLGVESQQRLDYGRDKLYSYDLGGQVAADFADASMPMK